MDKRKRAKLKAAGWTVGTSQEFLRLSDEEAAFVEFKRRIVNLEKVACPFSVPPDPTIVPSPD